jgi:hypothetical protein
MHDSESFARIRRSAHDGLNPRLAWWEWCAEYGEDVDDSDLWVRVNPAVAAGRVPCRPSSTTVPCSLLMLADPGSRIVSHLCIGIDAQPSRDTATVCVAGRRADSKPHVEWYETRDGVTWLPEWVSERLDKDVRAVVVDERNPAAELDWQAARVGPP